MATAAEIQTAYKAIYRADLNATVATAIANTGISLDAYIAQQLPQVASTTQAAVAIASFVTGTAPTSDKLDALKVEADKQVASYTALGVGNPSLGAYEAFGRSFATDTTTTAGFNTKYGALSTTDFVTLVYAQVYGTTPSAGALANLTGQINYFTNLYTTNGVANAALAAKGAVLGQIVGYAFVSSASANSTLDNQVQSLLTSAGKGDTTVYNKALPVVVDPGQVGVSIAINTTAGQNIVSTTAADPAFKSTANNDTITGAVDANTKIDAGAGEDVANLTYVAATKLAQLANVETVNLTNTTLAAAFDFDGVTGLKSVGFTESTVAGSAINLAAGVNFSVTDTTPLTATVGATFALKTDTTADVANLTVNGVNGGATVDLSNFETINLTASGVDSTAGGGVTITDAALKALTITATKGVTAALGAPAGLETITGTGAGAVTLTGVGNAVKTIDFSAASGAVKIADVGDAAISIKGGSGADTFQDITKSGAVVTTGAGNDIIGFNLAAASTATVTGGQGGDTIVLGAAGKVTVVYTAATDSTNANFDTVTGFDTGNDKIDLKAFALTTDKTAINTFTAAAALADGTDYFAGKAVAFGTFGGSADTFLLVDVNGDGKFNVNSDLIVKLAGAPVIGDIVFA